MLNWDEALSDFLDEVAQTRAAKTARFYGSRLRQLQKYAQEQAFALGQFRARQMRAFMGWRRSQHLSDNTLRHDAIAAKSFFKWCVRERLITSDPLADYAIPKRARPHVPCPSDDDLKKLLASLGDRWSPSRNANARTVSVRVRRFHVTRNYAIVTGLVDTAARIGEMLHVDIEDVDRERRLVLFRVTKGGEPRQVPVSQEWLGAVDAWLKTRPRCDSRRLFVTEYGGEMDPTTFARVFRGYVAYAGVTPFTLHGLRHFALTALAKQNVLGASVIAGHKSLVVTRGYLHADPEFVRGVHADAGPLRNLLVNKRSRERRKKLIR